jgi:hypothetical protein
MKRIYILVILWLVTPITLLIAGLPSGPIALADSTTYVYACPTGSASITQTSAGATTLTCPDGKLGTVNGANGTQLTLSCPGSEKPTINSQAFGNPQVKCASGNIPQVTTSPSAAAFTGDCGNGGVKVSITPSGSGNNCVGSKTDNPIYAYLRTIIKFAGGLFGILMVLMIVVSGIQYTTSAGNAQGIESAKKRIGNAVLGIILFLLMGAILNYLIPGGVL